MRVSTQEQAERGHSLDAQDARLRAYAELYGLDLVATEVDAGESAGSLDRPALKRALAMLRRGGADALLVVKLDRLTRRVRDLEDLLEGPLKKKALLSVEEHIDTATANGRMVLGIITRIGQWEREAVGERTAAVKARQRERGEYLGGIAPVGSALELDEDRSTPDRARYRVVPLEGELEAVAEARRLRSAGMSLRAISSTLAERGVVARCGRPFGPQALANALGRAP